MMRENDGRRIIMEEGKRRRIKKEERGELFIDDSRGEILIGDKDDSMGEIERKRKGEESKEDLRREGRGEIMEHHHRPEKFKLGILKKSMTSVIFRGKRKKSRTDVSFIEM